MWRVREGVHAGVYLNSRNWASRNKRQVVDLIAVIQIIANHDHKHANVDKSQSSADAYMHTALVTYTLAHSQSQREGHMHANTHTLQSSTPRAFSRYSLRVCIIVTYTLTHSQSQREGRLHVHAHTREFSIHELFQGTLFVCVSSSHIHENTHTDNTHKQHTLIHIHTRKHT